MYKIKLYVMKYKQNYLSIIDNRTEVKITKCENKQSLIHKVNVKILINIINNFKTLSNIISRENPKKIILKICSKYFTLSAFNV